MGRPLLIAALATTLAGAGACGGGATGEPLVSTSLTGQFAGQSFTPAFGVATVYQGSNLIAVGDGPINCGSTAANDPPMGTTATFSLPSLAAGTYASVFVDLIRYRARDFDGVGSSDATVTLTTVDAMSVAGTIDYSYTDASSGEPYGLSGGFEVTRCPM
ncbi:MAG TPA: hypothetical protein VHO06_06410 [Polyangia bacterium]|nr:hypothetical protein [Polyangia bacterium]